ncbi:hypothetical protein SAMN02745163_00717 [Clostridium cavendishii DSM 21758]|uniref:Uncharacterized protein n=1 Tax=Clostridium cavendishii DSM 21758 TaxID=1121302 RepID=A0A1M6DGE6_9CLOT|nr:hypothetical protein [Clostridium cavendishii]SHI72068.1 hypothetical protein SAMN02745163_00717 [Clostridium cavendishii DSM 21758]
MSKKFIYIILFLLFIGLVVKGNYVRGYNGLLIMMIGTAGILSELYMYNRKYR